MKKITIAMTVSAIFLVCILTTYGFLISKKISGYTTLEADLEEAAQMYLDTEKIKLEKFGDSLENFPLLYRQVFFSAGKDHLVLLIAIF